MLNTLESKHFSKSFHLIVEWDCIPGRGRDSPLLQHPVGSETHAASFPVGIAGIKGPGHGTDHLPPSSS
jgi:hypothetical protein